jgi:solute carrier family 25 phosphate transporter 23/24/25/41
MGSGPASVLSSAALAGATSTIILHPIEVVRSRVTCDRAGRYSQGITAAFGSIISKEGPAVLYTGLGSSLAAIIPEAAITYGMDLYIAAQQSSCLFHE